MKDIQYNRYVCELLAIRGKICLLFFGEEKGLVWGGGDISSLGSISLLVQS